MGSLPDSILSKLRPHQGEPAKHLADVLRQYPSAVDMSSCGTGKTYVACAVASYLKLPTLVIGPKISETSWARAAAHFGDEFDYCGYEKLRFGGTPFGQWQNPLPPSFEREYLKCLNCQQVVKDQPCYCHPLGVHCVEIKKRAHKYGKFIFHRGIKLAIFDEVHRCGGLDSMNADMLIAARRQGIKTLALSATVAQSPLQMRALGFALDIHSLDYDVLNSGRRNFYAWASKYKCRRDPRFHGFKWMAGAAEQRYIMASIRNCVIPARGVRVTTDDIPDFPRCQIDAELYDIEEADKINGLYTQMADALAELEITKLDDTAPDHPLTKILRARQQVELLKVPVAVELAQDYLAKGCSVALFVNFTQTIEELSERLNAKCIINGDPKNARNRQAFIDAFQANESRIIILNSDAGGVSVSLHDIHGGFPRVGLVMPGFNAVTFRQVVGRLPRDGGKSPVLYRVIFAANTVEVPVHRALTGKLNCLDALNDADLQPENLKFAA